MSTAETKEVDCKLVGLFSDPSASWDTDIKVKQDTTVEEVLGTICDETAKRTSAAYNLHPPIDPSALTASLFPNVEPKQMLSDVGRQLVAVLTPGDIDQGRLQKKVEHAIGLEIEITGLRKDLSLAKEELEKVKSESKGDGGETQSSGSDADDDPPQSVAAVLQLMKKRDSKQRKRDKEQRKRDEKQQTINGRLEGLVGALQVSNGRLEAEVERLEAEDGELRKQAKSLKKELNAVVNSLNHVTALVTPIHLRCLLDMAQDEITRRTGTPSQHWNALIPSDLSTQLAATGPSQLTLSALQFLCSHNNVWKEGNRAAHSASADEIKDAVASKLWVHLTGTTSKRSSSSCSDMAYDHGHQSQHTFSN